MAEIQVVGVTIEADSVVVKGSDFDALCAAARECGRLSQELSLAEEGLANYAQENAQFRKALEMIRDGEIPQAMSPALFAEFVLRGPVPQSAEHSAQPHK